MGADHCSLPVYIYGLVILVHQDGTPEIGKITKLSKCKQNGQFGDDLPVSFLKVL
jgi:hypothetical protein